MVVKQTKKRGRSEGERGGTGGRRLLAWVSRSHIDNRYGRYLQATSRAIVRRRCSYVPKGSHPSLRRGLRGARAAKDYCCLNPQMREEPPIFSTIPMILILKREVRKFVLLLTLLSQRIPPFRPFSLFFIYFPLYLTSQDPSGSSAAIT